MGIIYASFKNGDVLAIDNQGNVIWKVTADSTPNTPPSIDKNGNIYVGSFDKDVVQLDRNGTRSRIHPGITGQPPFHPVVVDQRGNRFFSSWQGFSVVDSDGKLQWQFKVSRYVYNSAPTIGYDGAVYVITSDSVLHAFDQKGQVKWTTKIGPDERRGRTAPVVLRDGSVVADGGGFGGQLYRFAQDGALLWRQTGASCGGKLLGVSSMDVIVVSRCENFSWFLYALNPGGTTKWRLPLTVDSAAIDAKGTVYAAGGGALHAVDVDGKILWSKGTRIADLVIGTDYTIYALTYDNEIYAISDKGNAWPEVISRSVPLLDSYPTQIVLTATDADDCELKFEIYPVSGGIVQKVTEVPCTPGEPNYDTLILDYMPDIGSNRGEIGFTVSDTMGLKSGVTVMIDFRPPER
jgi:outer membrane protein assembly factor BamB